MDSTLWTCGSAGAYASPGAVEQEPQFGLIKDFVVMPPTFGAGHDACWINRVAPTAMVMCPCVDGLSHNEAEEITKDWSTAGADVLFHAVVNTAEIID